MLTEEYSVLGEIPKPEELAEFASYHNQQITH
jgi:hypothetical protein